MKKILYSQQCPMVCMLKKEGGNTQKAYNLPHRFWEMEQEKWDGNSLILKNNKQR
jgi:hypothetical protein